MGASIHLNGNPRELEPETTIAALVFELGFAPEQVAVERNGELVPRSQHGATPLEAGDRVEVVTLVGGG